MEDLIPIGQFARASRLSQKALRLYDENGLLPPAQVHPDSGYRFYRLAQLRDATLIGLLRSAGMPLGEIRLVLDDPAPIRIDEYAAALADELEERLGILDYVRRYLEEELMYEVQFKSVEPVTYASITGRTRIKGLFDFVDKRMGELHAVHAAQAAGDPFTQYHGEVNEQDDGPVEVCYPADDGDKELPAGEVAFTIARGEQTEFPAILSAYEAVATFVKRAGRDLAGSPREIYRSDITAGEVPVMEIAWPVR